jgi:hypothetical protein
MEAFILVGVNKTCAVVTSLKSEGFNYIATEPRSFAGFKVMHLVINHGVMPALKIRCPTSRKQSYAHIQHLTPL